MNDQRKTTDTISREGVIAYFGYGSLVNRATHRTAIVDAVPARLCGWRRTWRPRPDVPGFPAALLTITEEEGAVCDGLLVFDRMENLAAVDLREARYNRRPVPDGGVKILAEGTRIHCPVFVYVVDEQLPSHPEPPRILRSYLDAVMQGILVEHGEEGLRRFVDETAGFGTAIHEDRRRPLYPRSVTLSMAERSLFDRLLAARIGPGEL